MANLQGYGASAVPNMLNHYTRHAGDLEQAKYRYANQNIDPGRTHLNYQIGVVREDPRAFVQSFVDAADSKPKETTNVISDWVVTLPKNERLRGREREFFECAYKHLTESVPEGLVVGAFVHMDENQPHMHFCFVPRVQTPKMTNDKSRPLRDAKGNVKRDKKGTVRYERVPVVDAEGKPVMRLGFGQTKVYDRGAMKRFHPELERAMERHFGFVVGIELTEEQQTEQALSNVPQESIDRARAAIVEPAQAQAEEIVRQAERKAAEALRRAEKAEERAAQAVEQAQGRVDALAAQADAQAERLESLRQGAERAERDVEELRPIAAEVRRFGSAGRREKGAVLDSIAAKCNGLASRCRAAAERIGREVERLLRPSQPSLSEILAGAEAAARAYNEGRDLTPSRGWSQGR